VDTAVNRGERRGPIVTGRHAIGESRLEQAKEPVFNIPGVIVVCAGVLAAIHLYRVYYLTPADGMQFLIAMAFIPARYAGFAGEIPGGEAAKYTSFITHMLIHADVVHLAINTAWLLAFGTVLSRRMGALRFLAFSVCGGIAGAALFLAFNPGLAAPVIGASGAVAAMMGGVMRFLFSALDQHRGYLLRENPAVIPRMDLKTTITDRRIVLSSIVFVVLNLAAIGGFGALGSVGAIAWEAHLGGYFFGLLAFAIFDTALRNPSPYGGEPE
jgi:membrane associated rhomboid family serine protease